MQQKWLAVGLLLLLALFLLRIAPLMAALLGAIAVLAPLIERVLTLIERYQPRPHFPSTSKMTPRQAAEILGVVLNATEQEIQEAHHRLIQRIHPDRGGSTYLAAQINQARDVLLEQLTKTS